MIVFGWKRSLPGREKLSAQHFQAFLQYMGAEKQKGNIESCEPVLLEPTGGDLTVVHFHDFLDTTNTFNL